MCRPLLEQFKDRKKIKKISTGKFTHINSRMLLTALCSSFSQLDIRMVQVFMSSGELMRRPSPMKAKFYSPNNTKG